MDGKVPLVDADGKLGGLTSISAAFSNTAVSNTKSKEQEAKADLTAGYNRNSSQSSSSSASSS